MGKKLVSAFLTLIMLIIMLCSFAIATETEGKSPETIAHEAQLIETAQKILSGYDNMTGYIDYVERTKLYYNQTLNEADYYMQGYSITMNYATVLANVGISAGTGSATEACFTVLDEARGIIRTEASKGNPVLTAEEFIYSQARMALDYIGSSRLYDLADQMENGRFVTADSAIRFILIHQDFKACFASARMARTYYVDQLNTGWLEKFGKLLSNVAVSQINGLLSNSLLSGTAISKIAKDAFNAVVILSEYYDNSYITGWKNDLARIEAETEELLRFKPIDGSVIVLPSISVIFDANGGHVGITQTFYSVGLPFDYFPVPFRFGYDFLGWYDDAGNLYTTDLICNLSGETTLKAKWDRQILLQGECGPNLTFVLYGDGLLDIQGYGPMYDIPWIWENSGEYAKRIDRVSLPEGLTTIHGGAFDGCEYLTDITLPQSLLEIGSSTFANTGLTSLTIPNGVTRLGQNILHGNTKVKEVTVPGSVTTMDSHYYSGDFWGVFVGSSVEKVVLLDGITSIGSCMFANVETLKEVVIPDTVQSIESYAFIGSGIESIELPESLREINGPNTFANTKLTELVIPNNVYLLGEALISDTNIATIVIPASVTVSTGADYTSYGEYYYQGPFAGSNLRSAEFIPGLTKITSGCFFSSKHLATVTIPNTVKEIYKSAFYECESLKDVYFLGTEAEWNSISIQQYNDPLSSATIHFLADTEVTPEDIELSPDLILPNDLTAIEAEAFLGGAFTFVKMSNSLERIEKSAFSDCSQLRYAYIPESVGYIHPDAFAGSNQFTIICPQDSYAKQFAVDNMIPYLIAVGEWR